MVCNILRVFLFCYNSLSLSLSLSVPICLSLSVCLSVCLSVSLPVYLCLSLIVCVSLSLSACLFPSVCVEILRHLYCVKYCKLFIVMLHRSIILIASMITIMPWSPDVSSVVWCCFCCIVFLTLCIINLRARHDHNKIAPCGMIKVCLFLTELN